MASVRKTATDFIQLEFHKKYVEVRFFLNSVNGKQNSDSGLGNTYFVKNVSYKKFEKFLIFMTDIHKVFDELREDNKPDLKEEAGKLKDELNDLFK